MFTLFKSCPCVFQPAGKCKCDNMIPNQRTTNKQITCQVVTLTSLCNVQIYEMPSFYIPISCNIICLHKRADRINNSWMNSMMT